MLIVTEPAASETTLLSMAQKQLHRAGKHSSYSSQSVESPHLVENKIQFDHSLQHLVHARMQCLRLLVCELVDLFRRNTMEMLPPVTTPRADTELLLINY